MSFLGGIGGSLFSSISQIALGAMTGGMSLMASFALQIASSLAQQVIQQVGQQLGLPQGAIDMALGAFSEVSGLPLNGGNFGGAVGEAVQQFGGSPVEQANLANTTNEAFNQLVTTAGAAAQEAEVTEGGEGSADSFLVALAKALGSVLDGKMTQMKDLANEMNQVGDSSQSKLGSLSGELNAVGQEVGILSNALKSTIETLGRAQADLAKKQ